MLNFLIGNHSKGLNRRIGLCVWLPLLLILVLHDNVKSFADALSMLASGSEGPDLLYCLYRSRNLSWWMHLADYDMMLQRSKAKVANQAKSEINKTEIIGGR